MSGASAESAAEGAGRPLSGGVSFAVLSIFLLSGTCALVYETVWQKMLCLVFGITTYATATILTAFMGGLALGSFAFGSYADRARRPLRIYAYLETGIGVFALLFPFIVELLTQIFAGYAARFGPSPLVIALVRFALCTAVLAVPAALMGGTLPLVSRFYVRRLGAVGVGTGALYGLNTLGGVFGCFLAGFVLMATFGTRATLYGAAIVNLVLAALAFLIDRAHPEIASASTSAEARGSKDEPSALRPEGAAFLRLVLVVAAVSGFCALAYEVFWTRAISFYFPSSLYAFPTMLTGFLLGSAIGSLLFARVLDRVRNQVALLAVVQILIAAAAIATIFEFSYLGVATTLASRRLGRGWASFVGTGFVASFLVMVVPCILMGIAFPAIAKIFTRSIGRLGRSIGSLYAVNTVGCVLGSALAGFAIIPAVGTAKGIPIVAALNAILGGLLVWRASAAVRARALGLLAVALVLAGGGYVAATWSVPLGFYGRKFVRVFTEGDKIIYYRDGVDGTITVTDMGHHPFDGVRYRDIEVDGVSVAGDSPVLRTTQKIQGHVPLLLFKAATGRDAERAFILGLGTGEASSCIARHGVRAVDCAELVGAEVGANHLFHHVNGRILENPKFNLIVNDARNHLLTTSRTYDVIQSDSVHPVIAFNTYTKEYYELCRRRLSDEGVFSTWIPLYAFTEDDMKSLVNTMLSVFPHVSIWWAPNYENKHAILVGRNHPIRIDYATFEAEATQESIRSSLEEIDLGRMANLLDTLVADETTLRDYARGAPLNTDDNLLLSFRNPKNVRVGDETVPENLEAFVDLGISILPYVEGLDAERREAIGVDRHATARPHVLRAMAAYYRAKEGGSVALFDDAVEEYRAALAIDPDDAAVRRLLDEMRFFRSRAIAERYSRAGQPQLALEEYRRMLAIRPDNPWTHNSIAVCYSAMGMPDRTVEALRRALAVAPDFAVARNNLALHYWNLGDAESAKRELQRSLEVNPYDAEANRIARMIARGRQKRGARPRPGPRSTSRRSIYRRDGPRPRAGVTLSTAIATPSEESASVPTANTV